LFSVLPLIDYLCNFSHVLKLLPSIIGKIFFFASLFPLRAIYLYFHIVKVDKIWFLFCHNS
jgi:hypothetical protein